MVEVSKLFHIYISLFLILGVSTLLGQTYRDQNDSLLLVLEQETDPILQVDLLNQISYNFRRLYPDSVLKYAELANTLAIQEGYIKGRGIAYKNIGIGKFKLSQPLDTVYHYYNEGLHFAKEAEDFDTQSACLNNIALLYAIHRQHYKAIDYFHRGLDLFEEQHIERDQLKALILGNLGLNYGSVGDTLKFEYYLKETVEFARLKDIKPILAQYLGHYGMLIYLKGDQERGSELLAESISHLEELGDYESRIYNQYQLARLYLTEGKIAKARYLVEDSHQKAIEINYRNFIGFGYFMLSRISEVEGDIDEAVMHAEAAIGYTPNEGRRAFNWDVLSRLAKLYELQGNYKKALDFANQRDALSDSLREVTLAKNAAKIESEYQYREQQQKIAFLNQEQENKERQLSRLYLSLIFGGFSIFIIAYLFVKGRQLNKTIKEKNKQLEHYIDSNLQLENFAFIASHDLKGPLRNIVSFAQLLERSAKNNLNQEEIQYLKFITGGTKDLSLLIDDLLDYSRIERTALKLEEIKVEELVWDVTNKVCPMITDELDFTLELHVPNIVADRLKVKQLLQNLICNAYKFSVDKPNPKITVMNMETADGWLFEVRDNGIGIDERYYDKIFLIFKRLHSKDAYQGSGIGLAICKKVIDQHRGKIWVESEIGLGSSFFFLLPKRTLSYQREPIPTRAVVAESV